MKYLFHNVYGDAETLIEGMDADVVCVPCGPTENLESKRNAITKELNISISCLPALIYWTDPFEIDSWKYPDKWNELRIGDLPTPWTWEVVVERMDKQEADRQISLQRGTE